MCVCVCVCVEPAVSAPPCSGGERAPPGVRDCQRPAGASPAQTQPRRHHGNHTPRHVETRRHTQTQTQREIRVVQSFKGDVADVGRAEGLEECPYLTCPSPLVGYRWLVAKIGCVGGGGNN